MKTSSLESLRIGRDRAEFLLDGRHVHVEGDSRSPAFAALKELHEHALTDYQTSRAAAAQRNGMLTRLVSWFGRFLRIPTALEPTEFAPPSVSPLPIRSTAPVAFAQANDPHNRGPRLHNVFADQHGVHVLWQETHLENSTATGAARAATEFTYSLDSELAQRLRRCFEELSILGYKVNGMELLAGAPVSAEPRVGPISNAQAKLPPAAVTPPTSDGSKHEGQGREHSDIAASASQAGTTSPEILMRLHPPLAEQPNRALVSPAEDGEKPEVLIAPERVLRALHAAASSSRPVAERLTYLRCSRGEIGLRILAVGFGEAGERTPSRWEDAKTWWNDSGQKLATIGPTQSAPRTATFADELGPTFVTGSSPLQQQRNPSTHREDRATQSATITPDPS